VELPGLTAVSDADDASAPRQRDDARRGSRVHAPLAAATPEASEALAETLDVRTPLLRRAFSNVLLPGPGASRDDIDIARDDTA
jgi:hypothetical protein